MDLQQKIHEYFGDEVRGLDEQGETYLAFLNKTLEQWNLTEFDPESKFGLRLPRWGTDKVYIDKDLLTAVEKLSNRDGFLQGSLIEKGTSCSGSPSLASPQGSQPTLALVEPCSSPS